MTFRRINTTLFGKLLTIAMLGMVGSLATGCAIHSQAPIKEVAYDFSDSDFYDKDYAPSPNHARQEYVEYEVVLPAKGAPDTHVMTFRQPAE